MQLIPRRDVLLGGFSVSASMLVAGCAGGTIAFEGLVPEPKRAAPDPATAADYARIDSEPFPVEALDTTRLDRALLRQRVAYATDEAPGTIVVDPNAHYLYFIEANGRAWRYGVAVGAEGSTWSGTATIHSKQEWPDWYPTAEMLQRRPDIVAMLTPLRSGKGIAGGPGNPIGARGMYLWRDGKDTLYRIHGTTDPFSVGKSVSSGCIRMINHDVIDLYARCPAGSTVEVLTKSVPPAVAAAGLSPTANGWLR